jgi:hypothetical protein
MGWFPSSYTKNLHVLDLHDDGTAAVAALPLSTGVRLRVQVLLIRVVIIYIFDVGHLVLLLPSRP